MWPWSRRFFSRTYKSGLVRSPRVERILRRRPRTRCQSSFETTTTALNAIPVLVFTTRADTVVANAFGALGRAVEMSPQCVVHFDRRVHLSEPGTAKALAPRHLDRDQRTGYLAEWSQRARQDDRVTKCCNDNHVL